MNFLGSYMHKDFKLELWLLAFLVILLIVIAVLANYHNSQADNSSENSTSNLNRSYCTNSSRNADMCIQVYQPVCGWNDPSKIQCIKYPCAQTYGNSCDACKNSNVIYWTSEQCPSNG